MNKACELEGAQTLTTQIVRFVLIRLQTTLVKHTIHTIHTHPSSWK